MCFSRNGKDYKRDNGACGIVFVTINNTKHYDVNISPCGVSKSISNFMRSRKMATRLRGYVLGNKLSSLRARRWTHNGREQEGMMGTGGRTCRTRRKHKAPRNGPRRGRTELKIMKD
jgi:hypothetical protein